MRRSAVIGLLLLPFAGAILGRLAGPFLARADHTVQVAARIWQEDSQNLKERTLQSEAFRDTGQPVKELFAEAREIIDTFCVGTAWCGAWCGLVIALKLFGLMRAPRREIYEVDQAQCVSCGRCYTYCPVERQRLETESL